jgi:hypothetical protein
MVDGIQLFAKVENRQVDVAFSAYLVTVGTLVRGEFNETDVIIYRHWRRGHECGSDKYEMISFNPVHKTAVCWFFPHGPPSCNGGSPWTETTDWLNQVAEAAFRNGGGNLLRINNRPQNLPRHFYL